MDCLFGEDEEGCDVEPTCPGDEWMCSDGSCIPGDLRCDYKSDCLRADDEQGCGM